MNTCTLIVFAAAAFSSTCCAKVTKLAEEDRKALVRGHEQVRMIRTMGEIPRVVAEACAAVIAGHEFRMAKPGEPFQVTDVVTDRERPWRRLIWVAAIPGYHVIHYEKGGIAHSHHLLLVADGKASKAARVVWAAVENSSFKTYDDFLAALKTQNLDDAAAYSH